MAIFSIHRALDSWSARGATPPAERFPLARELGAARVLSEDPDVVDFTFEIEERK